MKSIIKSLLLLFSYLKKTDITENNSMKYSLDNNEVSLQIEPSWIRVTTNSGYSRPLHGQTIDETNTVIKRNYHIVLNYYKERANSGLYLSDIEKVSLRIVLDYFNMYNAWRYMYKREKERDLTFLEKDFENSRTYYIIMDYFKEMYPEDYAGKCKIMLMLSDDKFSELEKSKYQYDTK